MYNINHKKMKSQIKSLPENAVEMGNYQSVSMLGLANKGSIYRRTRLVSHVSYQETQHIEMQAMHLMGLCITPHKLAHLCCDQAQDW